MGGNLFYAEKLRCQEMSIFHLNSSNVLAVGAVGVQYSGRNVCSHPLPVPRSGLHDRKGLSSGTGLIPNLWGLVRVFLTVFTTHGNCNAAERASIPPSVLHRELSQLLKLQVDECVNGWGSKCQKK